MSETFNFVAEIVILVTVAVYAELKTKPYPHKYNGVFRVMAGLSFFFAVILVIKLALLFASG